MRGLRVLRQFITKRRMLSAALWLCWALLLIAAFANTNRLAAVYPTASLRYDTPISNTAATNARRFAASEDESGTFWPTFWTEQQNIPVEGLNKASARCICFSGDVALVWPADFMQGSAPGPLDDTGCCISNTLAWQLWGNEDVTGYEMSIGKQNYTVRGVFREDDLLVMASMGEAAITSGWQAVELAGMPDGDVRAAALAFAQASGLGEPTTVVDGSAITTFAGFLATLPLVVMGVALLVALLRWVAKGLPGKGKVWVLAFVTLLGLALALPALLEMLPPAFIPTRFSDFAFWSRLATIQWEHIEEWLLLRPYHIDLQAKLLLTAQAGIFIAQGIVSVILIRYGLLAKSRTR